MKMEYLNEFVLVVRHGGFNRAARNLFVSQSTLSDPMPAMELELGFDLFKRCLLYTSRVLRDLRLDQKDVQHHANPFQPS